MRNLAIVFALAWVLGAAVAAGGAPIVVPVDSGQSTITVTLTATLSGIGASDSSTSRVAGYSSVKLQPIPLSTSIAIYDFRFEAIDQINLDLVFRLGFITLGRFTAVSRPPPDHIVLFDAMPGVALPPSPIHAGGSFTYMDVPTLRSGLIDYTATGIVCTLLQQQNPPQPCNGTQSLADGITRFETYSGLVSISPARVATLVIDVNNSGPIDPSNPDLGTLSIVGTVRGSVDIPLRGDANLDGTIDGRDAQAFVSTFLNPSGFDWRHRFAIDLNDDDAFDSADVSAFVDCILGLGCPD